MISLKQISLLAFGRPSRRRLARARAAAPRPRPGEAGYTLLFAVFLAASMLIMLSIVSLKITTQGQREQEEEMVWRGHQYERGIRRYVQKFGRYPTKIDDMVKATSGVRYMREAYKDPMNKADGSWRFIYVTPAGQLIGSVRYTSLVQMALMDKMASMGGSVNANIPGTSPLNGTGGSPFGNSSGFGSPGGFGSSSGGSFGSSSSGFGNSGSSSFGQQGNQGTAQGGKQGNSNQSGNQDDSGDSNATGNPGGNAGGNFGGNSPGGQNGLGGGNSSLWPERRRRRRQQRPAIRKCLRLLVRPKLGQLATRPVERARRQHHRRGQQSREALAYRVQARQEIQRVGIHLQPHRTAATSRSRRGRRWQRRYRPTGQRPRRHRGLLLRHPRRQHRRRFWRRPRWRLKPNKSVLAPTDATATAT